MFDCAPGNGSKRGGAGSRKENPDSSPTGPGCARTCGEDEKSGVTGDCHAPFRGSPGVKFPGATRRSPPHVGSLPLHTKPRQHTTVSGCPRCDLHPLFPGPKFMKTVGPNDLTTLIGAPTPHRVA